MNKVIQHIRKSKPWKTYKHNVWLPEYHTVKSLMRECNVSRSTVIRTIKRYIDELHIDPIDSPRKTKYGLISHLECVKESDKKMGY